ncbi:MAG: hypothetical protein DRP01_03055 [Archaeoglobales archaeon]|nr:MAG: hypothetical protein DRP01_03055 [Archaeoglobales archaeon]
MGARSFDLLAAFLGVLKQRKVSVISEQRLETLIKAHLGADPRTVKKYKQLLEEFNMIQRTKDGKIRINYNYNII